MNVVFDPSEWTASSPTGDEQGECAHPEWQALRSRLRAAVDACEVLGQARRSSARAFGSFSRRAAISLDRIDASCAVVNQTSSANRKCNGSILLSGAGLNSTGGRG